MRRRHLTAVLTALALAIAGCGDDDDDPTVTGDDTDAATPTSAEATADDDRPVSVAVAASDLGEILVDAEGMTLYLFTKDSAGASACADACAETWPPLLAAGEPVAGDGADAALLGTIERDDAPAGQLQVTYAGHPLYLYAPDAAPGDVTGHGVGDVWWAVAPDGEAVSADAG